MPLGAQELTEGQAVDALDGAGGGAAAERRCPVQKAAAHARTSRGTGDAMPDATLCEELTADWVPEPIARRILALCQRCKVRASTVFDWPQKQAERMAAVPYATGGLPPPEVAARNAISRKPGAYIKGAPRVGAGA